MQEYAIWSNDSNHDDIQVQLVQLYNSDGSHGCQFRSEFSRSLHKLQKKFYLQLKASKLEVESRQKK